MSEQSSRDALLAGIRHANAGRQAEAAGHRPRPAASLSRNALVDLFTARATAAQASVSVAADFGAARQQVADIVATLAARCVVVSDDARQEPWDVARSGFGETSDSGGCRDGSTTIVAKASDVGITCAAYGMADTGTIVVCSGRAGGRVESLLPPVHIALLKATDLLPGLAALLAALDRDRRFEQSSAVTFITGPSRTADIELTLTIGVHGPKQLFIVVVDEDVHRQMY